MELDCDTKCDIMLQHDDFWKQKAERNNMDISTRPMHISWEDFFHSVKCSVSAENAVGMVELMGNVRPRTDGKPGVYVELWYPTGCLCKKKCIDVACDNIWMFDIETDDWRVNKDCEVIGWYTNDTTGKTYVPTVAIEKSVLGVWGWGSFPPNTPWVVNE